MSTKKKTLICTVGGTVRPIDGSISQYRPDRLLLLASQQSLDNAVELKKAALKDDPDCDVVIETTEDPESLRDCYESARKLALKAATDGEAEVRVDYTGGTKSMSAAVVLATADLRFDYSYTGGTRRDREGMGRVEDGFEQLLEMPLPLSYLQSAELERVRRLYNGWNLAAAAEYCEHVAGLVGRNVSGEFYRELARVLEGYHCWDTFRHERALRRLWKGTDLQVLASHELCSQNSGLSGFIAETERALPELKKLAEAASGKRPAPSIELAMDLLANADRRADEGRYDDAVLRLYRIVEMTVQATLLENHGLHTDEIKQDQLSEREWQELTGGDNPRGGILKIPQEKAVKLLKMRNDPLWLRMGLRDGERRKIQHVRNHCYLEHQLDRSADQDKYKRFRGYVVDVMFNGRDVNNFPEWRGVTE